MSDKPQILRVYNEEELMSRKEMLLELTVGESVIFICAPGQSLTRLQTGISGSFRGGDSMKGEGLEQQRGLLVFENEVSLPVTRVTRVRPSPGI